MKRPETRAAVRADYVQHYYTTSSNSPPPNNALTIGEIGLELADPVRIWAGVPTSIDGTGRRVIYDSAHSGYTLPIATTTVLGGVIADGTSILITSNGVISSAAGGGGSGDFPEAPLDGHTYGRQSAAWNQVIAANNDIIDGGNFIVW